MTDKIINNKDFLESTKIYINEVVEHLRESQALEKVDSAGLDQLAYYYDTFTRISEIILKDGIVSKDLTGKWKSHPLSKELEACEIQLFKIQQEYGLTLRSRSKIKVLEKQEGGSLLEQWIELR